MTSAAIIRLLRTCASNTTRLTQKSHLASRAASTKVSKKAAASVMVKCPHCSFTASSNPEMKKHVVSVHNLDPYSCFHCGMGFTNLEKLRKHVRGEHNGVKAAVMPYEIVQQLEKGDNLQKRNSVKLSMKNSSWKKLPLIGVYPMKSDSFGHFPTTVWGSLYRRTPVLSYSSNASVFLSTIYPMKHASVKEREAVQNQDFLSGDAHQNLSNWEYLLSTWKNRIKMAVESLASKMPQ